MTKQITIQHVRWTEIPDGRQSQLVPLLDTNDAVDDAGPGWTTDNLTVALPFDDWAVARTGSDADGPNALFDGKGRYQRLTLSRNGEHIIAQCEDADGVYGQPRPLPIVSRAQAPLPA